MASHSFPASTAHLWVYNGWDGGTKEIVVANPEHVEILKQGVKIWNKWRDEERGKLQSLFFVTPER